MHPPVEQHYTEFKIAPNPLVAPKPKPKPIAKTKVNPIPQAKPRRVEAEWKSFVATAYTPFCEEGCVGITKSGIDVSNTTRYHGKQIIAVDPRIVPLGSTVEIRFANGEIIRATAQDIGSAIKGMRIDYLVATEGEAVQFGKQAVKLRVVSQ